MSCAFKFIMNKSAGTTKNAFPDIANIFFKDLFFCSVSKLHSSYDLIRNIKKKDIKKEEKQKKPNDLSH